MPSGKDDFRYTPAIYETYTRAAGKGDRLDWTLAPELLLWARDDMRELEYEDDADVIEGDWRIFKHR